MRNRTIKVTLFAMVLLAFCFPTREVAAEKDAKVEANEHFKRGIELVEEQAYEEAAIEFQKAYDISPHYSVLYNLGMAHVAMGHPVEAVDAFAGYLRDGGDAVSQSRRAEVEEEIKRQNARIAYVTMEIEPDGATVQLDDKELGRSPFIEPVRVGVGNHKIAASLDGYHSFEVVVTVAGEERKSVKVLLKRDEAVGLVDVRCPVPDVRISVDGQFSGQTPLSTPLSIPVGARELLFERQGYSRENKKVNVVTESMAHVECKLKALSPLPAAYSASLEVKASEPGAGVFVDGEPFTSPGKTVVGKHWVEVRRTGFKTYQSEVTLKSGANNALNAVLIPEPDYLRDYRSSAELQRILAYAIGGTGIAVGFASVVIFAWNDGRYGDWKKERDKLDRIYSNKEPYPEDTDKRQSKNDDLLRSIQDWDAVTIGTAIAGGALLTAGIVLFLTGDDPSEYDDIMLKAGKSSAAVEWTTRW
jgi:hypothetical protein